MEQTEAAQRQQREVHSGKHERPSQAVRFHTADDLCKVVRDSNQPGNISLHSTPVSDIRPIFLRSNSSPISLSATAPDKRTSFLRYSSHSPQTYAVQMHTRLGANSACSSSIQNVNANCLNAGAVAALSQQQQTQRELQQRQALAQARVRQVYGHSSPTATQRKRPQPLRREVFSREFPHDEKWASCSSDGVPSLPSSPGWAKAEEAAQAQERERNEATLRTALSLGFQQHCMQPRASLVKKRKEFQPKFNDLSSTPGSQLPSVRPREPNHGMYDHNEPKRMSIQRERSLSPTYTASVWHRPYPMAQTSAASECSLLHIQEEAMMPFTMWAPATRRASISSDMSSQVEDMSCGSCAKGYLLREDSGPLAGHAPPADLLKVGDCIGPGMQHDGDIIVPAQLSAGFASQAPHLFLPSLEIDQHLGTGSYAVVYLAHEVDALEPNAMSVDDVVTPCTMLGDKSSGTKYALKCLSKANLTPAQLSEQRLEATIHQSLPQHLNVVTLHCAYETSNWLFLVLEYCPGKDLYYWLQEASEAMDTHLRESADLPESVSLDMNDKGTGLSRVAKMLLSDQRLRMVSHMFAQMCDAVQLCHDYGVSHRDIKPENFIIENKLQHDALDSGVVVKLTDFGLATTHECSNEFHCGSKPYMAFECRHDLASSYDTKQADVWSLGIVLLNLLFLRSPFAEPSAQHCASFSAFSIRPVEFLMQAFDGLTIEVARFLCERVFCNVSHHQRRRITPAEFGQWALSLPDMLGAHVQRIPLEKVREMPAL